MTEHAPHPHPDILDSAAAATRQLRAIAGTREIAVDTEGASFHRFLDRIYLLQLSTRQHTSIIDPLSVSQPQRSTVHPTGVLMHRSMRSNTPSPSMSTAGQR